MAWYQKSADQGDANGQRDLGVIYYNGLGIPRDPAKGKEWILKAAKQGDADALEFIGVLR